MRVAVTGATGFIGRHVLEALRRRGATIIVLARDPAKVAFDSDIEVRKAVIGAGDLPDHSAIGAPDTLIHLAWGGLPAYRSLHHFETELPGQYAFLAHLVRTGLPALVSVGTCFEYGMQSGELHESQQTLPENCYGFAKDVLRRQLAMLKSQHHFDFVWGRLFYPFGAGQSPKSLLSQLQRAVENGEAVFNMSGGEQLRDYLPVETVADLLVELALRRVDCGPVNICSGKPVSVRGLVESWIAENRWTIDLNLGHYPYPDYEPMAFWGSATLLKLILAGSTTPHV